VRSITGETDYMYNPAMSSFYMDMLDLLSYIDSLPIVSFLISSESFGSGGSPMKSLGRRVLGRPARLWVMVDLSREI